MTTVAWRGEYLATDSAATQGTRQGRMTKLLRLPGVAYGFAGDASAIWQFMTAIEEGLELDEIKITGQFEGLMLTPDGCFHLEKDLKPYPCENEYWAIGSGGDCALGALHAGRTARQAVAAAIEHDTNSSGPVQWVRVRRRK